MFFEEPDDTSMVKLPVKTSFEASKIFETPKLKKINVKLITPHPVIVKGHKIARWIRLITTHRMVAISCL